MLKTFAIAMLAIGMSVGLAQAKGSMHKQKASPPCQTEQQANATCTCGPAKTLCQKGQWCHGFVGACTR
jgi:hypothetical protein